MRVLFAVLMMAALSVAPAVQATREFHSQRNYFLGPVSESGIHVLLGVRLEGGVMGVVWDGCSSDRHAEQGGQPDADLPCGTAAQDTLTLTVTEVTGDPVSTYVCVMYNSDDDCGDEDDGEWSTFFCGAAGIVGPFDTNRLHQLVVSPLFYHGAVGNPCGEGVLFTLAVEGTVKADLFVD